MHQVQAMVNCINQAAQVKRSQSEQMTLGELIEKLEGVPDTEYVVHLHGKMSVTIGSPHSYRGYYCDLAFMEVVGPLPTVEDVLIMLKGCMGKTFTGYKGGEFMMGESTPVWISVYGECSRIAPVDIILNEEKFIVTIITKEIDY